MFNWLKRKPDHSDNADVNEYLTVCKKLDLDHFVVFDTETTGLNPNLDRIVSIGAVKTDGKQLLTNEVFHRTIQVEKQSQVGVAVHGIITSNADSHEKEVLLDFLHFIGNRTLVAHHAAFDMTILNQALRRNFSLKLKNKSIDTAHLAIKKDHYGRIPDAYKSGDYTLDKLIERYGLPNSDRHTALGDAYITALLFMMLK